MPPLREVLLVALGGGVGSVLRFVAASAMTRLYPGFPAGTLLVNVVGCFCMGMLAGWTSDRSLRAALGVGLLGGFTTFSAFGGDTLALAQGGALKLAALNVLANVGLGLLAVWAGRAIVVG
ncbi:MAG: fluoride efflux transporter CrcB [Pseudomonadota bacterium]|nr:fluoride efflux transporter CrcB [Pseudomonadota bacterium]